MLMSPTVTLGFFDDIIIPAENLQHPSRFDETEHLWIWEYQTDDGKHDLFMDTGLHTFCLSIFFWSNFYSLTSSGEEIRFRVVAETFTDTTPSGPANETPEASPDRDIRRIPYLITVCQIFGYLRKYF